MMLEHPCLFYDGLNDYENKRETWSVRETSLSCFKIQRAFEACHTLLVFAERLSQLCLKLLIYSNTYRVLNLVALRIDRVMNRGFQAPGNLSLTD